MVDLFSYESRASFSYAWLSKVTTQSSKKYLTLCIQIHSAAFVLQYKYDENRNFLSLLDFHDHISNLFFTPLCLQSSLSDS